jgi:glycerophosphoryl diester phosphodiesterase
MPARPPFRSLRIRLMQAAIPAALALMSATASADAVKQLNGLAPLVLAHRGTTGYLPEHTLGGYELAVKMGADYIEPDLQLTRDGVLVAMHDNTLTRTTNVQTLFPGRPSYDVSQFTLGEIKQLTVRPVGTASTTYPGFTPVSADPYKIPTFQEVIDLAKSQSALVGREVGIYPEAKQADPVMEDKILQTLIANGYTGADKVFIQSFSIDTIRSIADKQKQLGADFDLVVLSSSSNALVTYGLANIAGFADGVGVSIPGAGIGEAFIDLAHAAGLLVHGYTFNRQGALADPEYQRFFNWGMDGVFSNYTDLAVAARDAFLAAQVPEPGTLALIALGLGAAGVATRRRPTSIGPQTAAAGA